MDIIFSASIIAAFIAGMVALFAPCCITVLLPAYLASAFREKKKMLSMTFLFFAGISAVIVPIGLGAAWLASFFKDFHTELYIIGGVLMLFFAAFAFVGKNITMVPVPKRLVRGFRSERPASAFVLGVFSGAATSCCAPVLAGAMTLAVISGAFWKAIIVTFAYVFGMTAPLFLAAYLYDKFQIEKSRFIQGKLLSFNVGAKTFTAHSTNLFASVVFLLMGIVLLAIAFSGTAFWAPEFQIAIGESLNRWSQSILNMLMRVSDVVWGALLLTLFGALAYRAWR